MYARADFFTLLFGQKGSKYKKSQEKFLRGTPQEPGGSTAVLSAYRENADIDTNILVQD